jgi:superfamily I DNA and RNA helicase
MALDVLITTDRVGRDPIGRDFIDHIRRGAHRLGLDDGALYYDFPTYSDYETVAHKPDALLLSRRHGIVAVRFVNGDDAAQVAALTNVDESLGQFCSILIGRLLKSRSLRQDRSNLLFPVTPLLFITALREVQIPALESECVRSLVDEI